MKSSYLVTRSILLGGFSDGCCGLGYGMKPGWTHRGELAGDLWKRGKLIEAFRGLV